MSKPHLISRLAGLVLLVLVGASAQSEDVTAHQLLNDLTRATEELHYTSTFTYEQGTSLESFRVFHWSEKDQTIERLEYLNGPERQLTQRLGVDECAPLGHRLLQGRLAASSGAAEIDQYYRILVQGFERVAGRQTRVVQIIPRDQMRYGYVWSLDRETGLLLKALVLDEQQRPVERFQFVELELVDDPAQFSSEVEPSQAPQSADIAGPCGAKQGSQPSRWSLRWLPAGFEFSGEKLINESSQMLMYTDGLTAFSIFVQPRADRVMIDGHAQRGATSIHMGGVTDGRQDYRLTVVGEIPGAVAERLAQSVVPRSAPTAQNTAQSGGVAQAVGEEPETPEAAEHQQPVKSTEPVPSQ